MNEFEKLVHLVNEAQQEAFKVFGPKANKAARTRLRVKMQEIKKQAQEVRLAVGALKSKA